MVSAAGLMIVAGLIVVFGLIKVVDFPVGLIVVVELTVVFGLIAVVGLIVAAGLAIAVGLLVAVGLVVAAGSVVAANNNSNTTPPLTTSMNDHPPPIKTPTQNMPLHPYLPQVLHAVHVVLQEVVSGDAGLFHVGEVGHAGPLVVRQPSALVHHVEAVLVLALDQRVPVVRWHIVFIGIRCYSMAVDAIGSYGGGWFARDSTRFYQ